MEKKLFGFNSRIIELKLNIYNFCKPKVKTYSFKFFFFWEGGSKAELHSIENDTNGIRPYLQQEDNLRFTYNNNETQVKKLLKNS